jgi:hypothetical protein
MHSSTDECNILIKKKLAIGEKAHWLMKNARPYAFIDWQM